jgi:hypothetical protein
MLDHFRHGFTLGILKASIDEQECSGGNTILAVKRRRNKWPKEEGWEGIYHHAHRSSQQRILDIEQ